MESKRAPTKKLAEKWRRPSVSDDITTCKICSRDLVEPRTLPCMHSFCEECILVLLQCYEKQNKLDRTFHCPTCRVRTPCHVLGKVSRNWIQMFPRKQILDSMKEAILVVEEMCNPCSMTWKITPASAFCTECHVYTCAACQIDHKNNPQTKHHHMANYIVKEMKNVPVANISKFNCKQHKNLRYSSFCEIHKVFLCNTCRESVAHRNCRVTKRVIEATGNITKAETKLNVINTLKRDERSQGKHLLKLIEQVDAIQGKLERCRQYHVELYCNYVRQATITEQKTEAVDALKGKLEFDKTHQDHDVINTTMTKVEDILTRYVDVFYDVTDAEEKAIKSEINKGILDIEKILARPAFDAFIAKKDPLVTEKPAAAKKPGKEARAVEIPFTKTLPPAKKTDELDLEKEPLHMCKKHVDDTLSEEAVRRLGSQFLSVGAIAHGKMAGTAFRVGSSYVMTAAHTVRDIVDPDRKGNADWTALDDPGVFLTFDSPMTSQGHKYRLNPHVCFLDDDLNVAVLEVMVDGEPLPPPVVLTRKDLLSVGVPEVSIIGYGHVGSHSKHLDVKCGVLRPDSDRVAQALLWLKREERKHRCNLFVRLKDATSVTWNYNEMHAHGRVALDCCMEYRALGAPVIVDTGPSGVEVLGVLTDSTPDCITEWPRSIQDRYNEYRFEIATMTSAIYEKMRFETRSLADDIFIRDKNYYDYSKYERESTATSDGIRMMSFSDTSEEALTSATPDGMKTSSTPTSLMDQ